jgi:hypothetical protein
VLKAISAEDLNVGCTRPCARGQQQNECDALRRREPAYLQGSPYQFLVYECRSSGTLPVTMPLPVGA